MGIQSVWRYLECSNGTYTILCGASSGSQRKNYGRSRRTGRKIDRERERTAYEEQVNYALGVSVFQSDGWPREKLQHSATQHNRAEQMKRHAVVCVVHLA